MSLTSAPRWIRCVRGSFAGGGEEYGLGEAGGDLALGEWHGVPETPFESGEGSFRIAYQACRTMACVGVGDVSNRQLTREFRLALALAEPVLVGPRAQPWGSPGR